ncbi:hypothetical protein FOZ61_002632, partial [Perkinsus olseni]
MMAGEEYPGQTSPRGTPTNQNDLSQTEAANSNFKGTIENNGSTGAPKGTSSGSRAQHPPMGIAGPAAKGLLSWLRSSSSSTSTALRTACSAIAGVDPGNVDNDPMMTIIEAGNLAAKSSKDLYWFSSVKELYDADDKIAKALDENDATKGLKDLSNMATLQGWGITVMVTIILYHHKDTNSNRRRVLRAVCTSFLRAADDHDMEVLLQSVSDPRYTKGSFEDFPPNRVADLPGSIALASEVVDGFLWRTLTHLVLTAIQSSEFSVDNLDDLEYQWQDIRQKKDEYVGAFLLREGERFQRLESARLFVRQPPMGDYARMVSICRRLQPQYKKWLATHLREKDKDLVDMTYPDLVAALHLVERLNTRSYEFEYDWDNSGDNKEKSNNKWSKEEWAAWKKSNNNTTHTESKGKKHDCPHCGKKNVRHPAELCRSNPANKGKEAPAKSGVENADKKESNKVSSGEPPVQQQPTLTAADSVPQFMATPQVACPKTVRVPRTTIRLEGWSEKSFTAGFDSYAEVSLVNKDVVLDSWSTRIGEKRRFI